jgi:hypothetical protein
MCNNSRGLAEVCSGSCVDDAGFGELALRRICQLNGYAQHSHIGHVSLDAASLAPIFLPLLAIRLRYPLETLRARILTEPEELSADIVSWPEGLS